MIEALCWPRPCPTLIHTYYACPQPSTLPWALTPAQPDRPASAVTQSPKPTSPSPVVGLQACVEARINIAPNPAPNPSRSCLHCLRGDQAWHLHLLSWTLAHSCPPRLATASSTWTQVSRPPTSSLLVQEAEGLSPHPTRPMLRAEQHPPYTFSTSHTSTSGHPLRLGRPCSPWGHLGSKSCLVCPGPGKDPQSP
uniref:Uncharacterized protein n=1 Tax=Myotis myotis TaxID=51298 RepID=A0A7J7TTX0_MYOMY|nr:hypothetical protein mMyoMyo1_009006 [Myotis myotis]